MYGAFLCCPGYGHFGSVQRDHVEKVHARHGTRRIHAQLEGRHGRAPDFTGKIGEVIHVGFEKKKPCYGCTERYRACQDTCPKREEEREMLKKRRHDKLIAAETMAAIASLRNKRRRKKGGQP